MADRTGLLARGAYRGWQFWQVVRARPLSAEARRQVAGLLTEDQLALFDTMNAAGRQHGHRVMKTLVDAGHDEASLLVAALLHDVAKAQSGYTWLDRVKVVLTQRLAPRLAARWATGRPQGWSRAYVVKAHHPAWSADAVAKAGGNALCVALIRRHQDPLPETADDEENRLLALLQWADDQS